MRTASIVIVQFGSSAQTGGSKIQLLDWSATVAEAFCYAASPSGEALCAHLVYVRAQGGIFALDTGVGGVSSLCDS